MSTSHATLSAASDDRKARLAKLKNLKRKQPADEIVAPESERAGSLPAAESAAETELTTVTKIKTTTTTTTTQGETEKAEEEEEEEEEEEVDVARLHLSGRNYDAENKAPKLGFEAPPTLGLEERTLEAQAADVEAEVRRQRAAEEEAAAGGRDRGIDLFKLQPRKPNWDLKRDLAAKLEVLAVRTDNAIARLVRERIAGAQKAAARSPTAATAGGDGDRDGDAAGMDGVALVEGVRVREREEEEDERREREEEDNLL